MECSAYFPQHPPHAVQWTLNLRLLGLTPARSFCCHVTQQQFLRFLCIYLLTQGRDSSLLVDGERHPHVHLLEDVGTFLSRSCGGGWVVGAPADVIGRAAGADLETKELAAIM